MPLDQKFYNDKKNAYFSVTRTDIEGALDAPYESVLEIGCGSGDTLAWLKREEYVKNSCGVELTAAASELSRKNADTVHCLNAESDELPFKPDQFDLILLLDVLEHTVDPWALIEKLSPHLRPGGRMIVSIPNIRNLRALLPLVFLGKWEYEETGLLDRTHLRFFTRKSILGLFTAEQWQLNRSYSSNLAKGRMITLLNNLTLRLFEEFITLQYIVAVDKK